MSHKRIKKLQNLAFPFLPPYMDVNTFVAAVLHCYCHIFISCVINDPDLWSTTRRVMRGCELFAQLLSYFLKDPEEHLLLSHCDVVLLYCNTIMILVI